MFFLRRLLLPSQFTFLLFLALTLCAATAETPEMGAGWKFLRADAKPDATTSEWESVRIPHTWNATDAADGGSDSGKGKDAYYRGPGWYAKTFPTPTEWKDQRIFLRFDGVSSVADVYFNGSHLGQHRGAFTAFCFEITSLVAASGDNELRIRADNSPTQDVPPLSGDFPIFGGCYRPVKILLKPQTCITPLDHASPGVYLSQKSVTPKLAEISLLAKVSHAGKESVSVLVACKVFDGDKLVVEKAAEPVLISPGAEASFQIPLTIANPHLWDGLSDPHLYRVEVTLSSDGQFMEKISQPLGLRFYSVNPKTGFFLNGHPYRLFGVNRHQDREGKGWAISSADLEEDHQLIKEIGARAVRFSHYPHAAEAYDLCDRDGILAWAEIPLVSKISDKPAFAAQARQELTEMIRQNYNHPSIFTWGLFNELYMAGGPDAATLITELNTLAKSEDPDRPTICATQKFFPPTCTITDLIGFNDYPGWYWGQSADMEWKLTDFMRDAGSRGACASEYGAGASIHQHEFPATMPKHNGHWHPEEWQALVHETTWQAINANSAVWGSFVWNMFDFASDWRDEGDRPGINDKGLVTYDRQTRKDAFYFYKANWAAEPFVYITSRRFTERTDPITDVKIYSNAAEAELFLNGKSLGKRSADALHRLVWKDINLKTGDNEVTVKARTPKGKALVDSCLWHLK